MVKKHLVNKFAHTRSKRINHKRNRTNRGGMGESMVEDIVEDIDMGDDKIDSSNREFNAQYEEAYEKNEDDQDIRDEDEEAHLYLNYFKDAEEIYEDYIKKRNDDKKDNPAEKLAKFYYDMGNREDKPTIISFFDYNAGIDYDFLLKNKDKDSMLKIIDRIDKRRFFENLFSSNNIYDGMPYKAFIPLFLKLFNDDFPNLLEKYVGELEPPSWVTVSAIQGWRAEQLENATLADLIKYLPEYSIEIDKLIWFCNVAVRFCEYYLNIHNSNSLDGVSGQLMRTFTVNQRCHVNSGNKNDTEIKPWYTAWIIQRHKFRKNSGDIYEMRAKCLEYFMARTFSLLITCMQFAPTELPTSMNAMGLNYKKRKPRKSRKSRKPRKPRKSRKPRQPRQHRKSRKPRQHKKSRKHGTLKGMVRKDARLAYE